MPSGKYIEELDKYKAKATKEQEKHFNIAQAPKHKDNYTQAPKHPQAVLKVIGFRQGAETRRTMEYIARLDEKKWDKEEQLELETQDGIKLSGKDEIDKLYREWEKDFDWPSRADGKNRHATHIVLSAQADVNDLNNGRVEQAAREFLHEHFGKKGYEYAFVLHTDTNNPHVHVVIKNYNRELNRKLRMNKDDLYFYREQFGNQLSINGLEHITTLKLDEPLEYFDEKINDVREMLERYGRNSAGIANLDYEAQFTQEPVKVESIKIAPVVNVQELLNRYSSKELTPLQFQTLKKELYGLDFKSLDFANNPEAFIKLDAVRAYAIKNRDIETLDRTFELVPDDISIKVEAYSQAFNISEKDIQKAIIAEHAGTDRDTVSDDDIWFVGFGEDSILSSEKMEEKKVELVMESYRDYNLLEREFGSEEELKTINDLSDKFESEMLDHFEDLTKERLYNELYSEVVDNLNNFDFAAAQKQMQMQNFKKDDLQMLEEHYSLRLEEISSSSELNDIYEKIQFEAEVERKSNEIDFDPIAHEQTKSKIIAETVDKKHHNFIKADTVINSMSNAKDIHAAQAQINNYFAGDKNIDIKAAYKNKELRSLINAEARLYNNKHFDPVKSIQALPVIQENGKTYRAIGTGKALEEKLLQTAQKQVEYLKTLADKGIILEDKEKGGFSVISNIKLEQHLKSKEHESSLTGFIDSKNAQARKEYIQSVAPVRPSKAQAKEKRFQGYNAAQMSTSLNHQVNRLKKELETAKMKGTSRNKYLRMIGSMEKQLKQTQRLNADKQVKDTIEYLKNERVNILNKAHVEFVKDMPFDKKMEHAIKTLNQQMSLAAREIRNINNTLDYVDEQKVSRSGKKLAREDLTKLRDEFVDGGLKIMDETNKTLKSFVDTHEKRLKDLKLTDPSKHKAEVKAFDKRLDDFKSNIDFRKNQLKALVTPKELNRFNALSIQQTRTINRGKSFSIGIGL